MIKTLKIFITILMMIDSSIKVELTPNRVDKWLRKVTEITKLKVK